MRTGEDVLNRIDELYRSESRRVFATLVRLLGDMDLAEEALHEAFRAAIEQWPVEGEPSNPRSWLVSTGRFKAIDAIRRRSRFDALGDEAARLEAISEDPVDLDHAHLEDDRLRLIFTCCHPALGPDVQVALTLREVCGLATEEIARAFLTTPTTLAQRIVRAKAKIRDAGIPYQVPAPAELPERLESVLRVIYLVFNEGYSPSEGAEVTRADLSGEAIRLGGLLSDLLPDPEVKGLLALMVLTESRRAARTDAHGDLVRLEDQDRSLWNQELIDRGEALIAEVFSSGRIGAYTIQAAISAVHARAADAGSTDWSRIVTLYDLLLRVDPSPVVELNRSVAVAMKDGPAAGLALIDQIEARGFLGDYHLLHAARADLAARQGDRERAVVAYRRALELVKQEPERRFLQRRLEKLEGV